MPAATLEVQAQDWSQHPSLVLVGDGEREGKKAHAVGTVVGGGLEEQGCSAALES